MFKGFFGCSPGYRGFYPQPFVDTWVCLFATNAWFSGVCENSLVVVLWQFHFLPFEGFSGSDKKIQHLSCHPEL